ncbi:MAG: hypothetical protein KGJ93_03190 [Patescibacteria group bacterium]|nr:hypothetical protein [Patescibacteria group bacterium]
MGNQTETKTKRPRHLWRWLLAAVAALVIGLVGSFNLRRDAGHFTTQPDSVQVKSAQLPAASEPPQLDTAAYDLKLLQIANLPPPATSSASSSTPTSTTSVASNPPASGWPVKTVYPNYGALLPFHRIVAYYGNLYSTGMGVLGEYPENVMLDKLAGEAAKWQAADPSTPVIPALHYIAVVAQAGPGKTGKYIARMPDSEIDKVLAMAQKINGLVFLDVQVGQSNVQTEVPLLEKYLKLPNVHLGIDPEFAMKAGQRPGTAIGTLDAKDINFAAQYLAKLVKDNNLPPKILIVHRFTNPMLTNYQDIKPLPEVQIVMNMDGFGGQANKLNTYRQYIAKQPVQFTGFKLFYHNDAARGPMLTPEQLLKLSPIPVYIQYQ